MSQPATNSVTQPDSPASGLGSGDKFGVWQPIETAPLDGTHIILAGPSGYGSTPLRVAVCAYYPGYCDPWRDHAFDGWQDGGAGPTHWMPLPPLPSVPDEPQDRSKTST